MRTTFSHDIGELVSPLRLDPLLVEAVVIVESGGSPFAWKPEPPYRWLWDVKLHKPFRALTEAERVSEVAPSDFWSLAGSREQEWWAQQASWGLMQIMGSVARENGFRGPYIPEIVANPQMNLELGIKHLHGFWRRANGNYEEALGAYNAGWGGRHSELARKYIQKVMTAVNQL